MGALEKLKYMLKTSEWRNVEPFTLLKISPHKLLVNYKM